MVRESKVIKIGLSDGELRPDEILAVGFLREFEKEIIEDTYELENGFEKGKFRFIRTHVKRTFLNCDVILDFKHKLKSDIGYKDIKSLYDDLESVLINMGSDHGYIKEMMRESKLPHKFIIFVLWLNCPECGKKEQARSFNLAVDYAARLIKNIRKERFYVLGASLDDYVKLTAIETPKFLAAIKAAKTKLYGYDK